MQKKLILSVGVGLVVVGGVLLSSGAPSAVLPSSGMESVATTKTTEVLLRDGDRYAITMSSITKEIAGVSQNMLAYNGSIPGPTVRVKQGDEITIVFRNDTDMKTLLHSHGVRMEDTYDGSQLTQKEMEPGEVFEYKLKFPDAGVFWYHPHVRDDMQQVLGAYGNYIVEPTDPEEFPMIDRDEILAVGDILMEGGKIAPYSKDFVTHALMGRFGNTMFVNGSEKPIEYAMRPGEVVRFYLTNVASVRPFNVVFGGAEMKLVGSDSGPFEKETFVGGVQIHPSERYIVDVRYSIPGEYKIEHRVPGGKTYLLGNVSVSGDMMNGTSTRMFSTLRTRGGLLEREMEFARGFLEEAPDKKLRFTVKTDMNKIMSTMMGGADMSGMDHSSMMGHSHAGSPLPVEWEDGMGAMNIFSTDKNTTWVIRDDETGKENMDINWNFNRGEWVKVRLYNDPSSDHPMQHPFHTHGNRFIVLATNNIPNENMAWKDTTLVSAGDTVDILIEMANPGKWMAHCHILEHLHSGMMIGYTVR